MAETQSDETTTGRIATRSPWAAAIWGFCLPGLGHFYCAGYRKAAIWFILYVMVTHMALAIVKPGMDVKALKLTAVALGSVHVLAALAAAGYARSKDLHMLGPANRWWVYLIILFLGTSLAAPRGHFSEKPSPEPTTDRTSEYD